MFDHKTVLALVEDVNKFNDGKFVSVVENSVLIQNEKTGSVFSFPISFNEDLQTYTLDGTKSVCVEKVEIETKEDESSLEELCEDFLDADEEDEKESFISMIIEACKGKSKKKKKKKEEMEGGVDVIEQPASKYEQVIRDFISLGDLFTENDEVVQESQIFLPNYLLSLKEIKENLDYDFLEKIESYNDFIEEVDIILDSKELKEHKELILKNVNLFGEQDVFSSITKNLVKVKKEKQLTVKIDEVAREISESHKKHFSEILSENFQATLTNNTLSQLPNSTKYNFLRFKTGIFSKDMVGNLLSDFESVMAKYNEMSQDELMDVQKMKNVVEYMWRTENFNDQVIEQIIQEFNSRYSLKPSVVKQVA